MANPGHSGGFAGEASDGEASNIRLSTHYKEEGAGAAGNLLIKAGNISFADGAYIRSETYGRGKGGTPQVFVYSGREWVTLGNEHVVGNMAERDALSARTGDVAYVVDLDGDGNPDPANFLYADGKWLDFVRGDGNDITITADTVRMTGSESRISTSTAGHGNAGNITLTTRNLEMNTEAFIRSESSSEKFGGSAGTITVNAGDSVTLKGGSNLTTEANDAGGGRVLVNAENRIYLLDGNITSSVKQGAGKGGDVEAQSKFVIMNHGDITANADEGDGGAIFIRTENFLKSSDSSVTAASNRGNEGNVRIEAPDVDISGGLIILPGTVLDAARWMKTPCTSRTGEDVSRFVIIGKDAMPTAPDDLLPSPASLWLGE